MTDRREYAEDGEPEGEVLLADILDLNDAVKRVGSEKLLRKVASLFLVNSVGLVSEVREAISEGDARRLERAAHTLVSSMAYLSARPATDSALEMEAIGRERRLDAAGEALIKLEAEVGRLRQALTRLTAEEEAPRGS